VGEDLSGSNVNRSYTLAATCIAIFTFTLVFLYPRYVNGEAIAWLFQAVLVVLGSATFSFVFSSLLYYGASLQGRIEPVERARFSRWADRLWLLGYTLLFLDPSIVLASVHLIGVGAIWFVLWMIYVGFVLWLFPRVQSRP
jgi:hypothetical protein